MQIPVRRADRGVTQPSRHRAQVDPARQPQARRRVPQVVQPSTHGHRLPRARPLERGAPQLPARLAGRHIVLGRLPTRQPAAPPPPPRRPTAPAAPSRPFVTLTSPPSVCDLRHPERRRRKLLHIRDPQRPQLAPPQPSPPGDQRDVGQDRRPSPDAVDHLGQLVLTERPHLRRRLQPSRQPSRRHWVVGPPMLSHAPGEEAGDRTPDSDGSSRRTARADPAGRRTTARSRSASPCPPTAHPSAGDISRNSSASVRAVFGATVPVDAPPTPPASRARRPGPHGHPHRRPPPFPSAPPTPAHPTSS